MIRRSLPYSRTQARDSFTSSGLGELDATQSAYMSPSEGVQSIPTVSMQSASDVDGAQTLPPAPYVLVLTFSLQYQDSHAWNRPRVP